MTFTFRIKSYFSRFGSAICCRKKPLNVKIILSFFTKSGTKRWIGADFTRPYTVAGLKYLIGRREEKKNHKESQIPKKTNVCLLTEVIYAIPLVSKAFEIISSLLGVGDTI